MSRLLHAGARAEELAVTRIVVFGLLLVTFVRVPLHRFADFPAALIEPRGVMRLLPMHTMLGSADLLWTLRIALVLGCVACIVGVRPYRWFAVPTVLLALFHDGAMRSLAGFDIHLRLTLLYVAAVLAVSPCVDAYAVHRRRREDGEAAGWRYAGPMLLVSLVVTVTYSLVGAHRILANGVRLFTSETATIWMVARSMQPSEYDFTAGLLLADWPLLGVLATVGMLMTSLMEAASPLALRWRLFRWGWVAAVLSFHVVVLVAMNILFAENVVLVLLLFTPFTAWVTRRAGRSTPDAPVPTSPTAPVRTP